MTAAVIWAAGWGGELLLNTSTHVLVGEARRGYSSLIIAVFPVTERMLVEMKGPTSTTSTGTMLGYPPSLKMV